MSCVPPMMSACPLYLLLSPCVVFMLWRAVQTRGSSAPSVVPQWPCHSSSASSRHSSGNSSSNRQTPAAAAVALRVTQLLLMLLPRRLLSRTGWLSMTDTRRSVLLSLMTRVTSLKLRQMPGLLRRYAHPCSVLHGNALHTAPHNAVLRCTAQLSFSRAAVPEASWSEASVFECL